MHQLHLRMSRARSLPKALLALATAAFLVVGGNVAAAVAAPPYATDGVVTNIEFVDTEVQSGSQTELTANWSLPDNPETPAGFTIDLPEGLAGRGDTFTLTAQDTGEVMGTCVVTETQLQCDISSEYIAENPRDLRGDVHFWVRVSAEVDEATETTYDFGTESATITVTPPPVCTEDCPFDWSWTKDGGYNYADDTITWWVHVGADESGMRGGEEVVIRDTVSGAHTLRVDGAFPSLHATTETAVRGDIIRPVHMAPVPRDEYTVDADGTIRFTAKEGYFYQAIYLSDVTDGGASGTYANTVAYEATGQAPGSVSREVRYSGGGGTGIGTDVGVFTIEKQLGGTATNLPADLEFTGTYSALTPAGETITGTYAVAAGATWRSPELPRDSVITLTEDAPAQPENVTWGEPVFSSNDFDLPGGTLTPITLTNTADVQTGAFSASKAVEGALALLPEDATFSLDYSYAAGVGFDAGSGTLELAADGTVVTSPQLPVGAVLTLSEQTPAPIEGATWGEATIEPSSVTIGADDVVAVQVTNPLALATGQFSMQKVVEGTGAQLVPADASFTVQYSYPEGVGYAAGSGQLEVLADGTVVTSPELPYGAVVSFEEVTPGAVDGAEWVGQSFDVASLVIGDGTVGAVVLTNTIETTPVPPVPPVTPTPTPQLPVTGGEIGVAPIAIGLLASAIGGLLLLRRRGARA